MKIRSIKTTLSLIFLAGIFMVILVASATLYVGEKARKDIERINEESRRPIAMINHLQGDLKDARVYLMTMIGEREAGKKAYLKEMVGILKEDTAQDFEVLINDPGLSYADIQSRLIDAKEKWTVFADTRDGELIPLSLAGKDKEAMELATGVQQDRYMEFIGIMDAAHGEIEKYVKEERERIEEEGRRGAWTIIAFVFAGGVFGGLIFFVITRNLIFRIGELKDAAGKVSEGDLSTRVAVRGEDEIALLGEAFNDMADWIQEDMDTILKEERELLEKNAMLNEAMIEREQHSKVIEWEAQRREEQNKKLQDAVEELEAMNRQLSETQTQLLQSEKMASIGQLAAGVAHEINNPVGFMNGNMSVFNAYIEDIKELVELYEGLATACRENGCDKGKEIEEEIVRFKEDKDIEFVFDDLSKLIAESRDGLTRVTSIVRDLKEFSHVDEAEFKDYDINKGLDSAVNIAWNEIKYKAEVKKDYGNIPMVYCYPQQLNQVFMNLLVNAAHAIEDKNPPKSPFDKGGLSDIPPLQKGGEGGFSDKGLIKIKTYHDNDSVFVEISDNGCGIPEEKIGNIFDPFFTTKPVGKGTGLGLSVVYNIVKKHKGDVDVKSKLGEGTTFTIRVPMNASLEEMSS